MEPVELTVQDIAADVALPGSPLPAASSPQPVSEDAAGEPQDGYGRDPGLTHAPHRLSFVSIAVILLFVLGSALLIVLLRFRALLLLAVLYSPTAVLFWWASRKYAHLTTTDALVRRFGVGIIAVPVVTTMQGIAIFMLVLLLRPLESEGSQILLIIIVPFIWVVPEELLKFIVARHRYHSPEQDSTGQLLGSMSVALGYITTSCTAQLAFEAPSLTGGGVLFYSAVMTVTFMPVHLLTAYIIGLKLAKLKELRLPLTGLCSRIGSIVAVPVCIRTVFTAALFGALHSGWWPLLSISVVDLIAASVYARHIEKTMPVSYLRRVGYMHVMGYGRLTQVEDSPSDQEGPEGACGAPAEDETRV
eukprot:TRINITY_DN44135_c0_g1_i1.p1 TRINITY_DN44135_c0_g1~~TRINITY_DN44135_c0_g1_i1.p1  ORF type:complete len:380 (+),score=127.34 TRINITY_DN44135_c0_g1_i1:59-1141(+)